MENISTSSLLKSLRGHYEKGEFEESKDLLLKNKDAFPKGEFHYNLGTVYSKMGFYAIGRFHMEKSIISGYETVAVKHNLKAIKKKLLIQEKELSFREQVDYHLLSHGLDLYIGLSLFLILLSLVLYSRRVFKRGLLFLFVLLSLIPIGVNFFYVNNLNTGISFKEIKIYEGPSKVFEEIGAIPGGEKLIISKVIDGWLFIQQPMEYAGWVKNDSVGVLK